MSDSSARDEALYDPDRHNNQLVAVFEDRSAADRAREALLGAGVSEGAIEVLDADPDGDPQGAGRQGAGIWGAMQNLFAPAQDHDDYGHALGRGHAMVVVTPVGGTDRQLALEVLEASEPLDFDAKRAEWRGPGHIRESAADHAAMNRATVTRADLTGKEPRGRDEDMVDMTGQPMRMKSMSAEDMDAATESPITESVLTTDPRAPSPQASAQQGAVEAEPASPRQATYTYGVPPEVASELSHEQQVQRQQPARAGSVEQRPGAVRVAERDPGPRT